jgi:hypothetical protein
MMEPLHYIGCQLEQNIGLYISNGAADTLLHNAHDWPNVVNI